MKATQKQIDNALPTEKERMKQAMALTDTEKFLVLQVVKIVTGKSHKKSFEIAKRVIKELDEGYDKFVDAAIKEKRK